MKNIFLVGMPGSGKSTIGKSVAETLHRPYLDTDEEIARNEKMTPEAIILMHGEEKLRSLERELLLTLQEREGLVISTGGGFPVFHDNMRLMNEEAITLYLKYPLETLWNRLESDYERPLSKSPAALSELLEKRAEVYEKAQIVVSGTGDCGENTTRVLLALRAYGVPENPKIP